MGRSDLALRGLNGYASTGSGPTHQSDSTLRLASPTVPTSLLVRPYPQVLVLCICCTTVCAQHQQLRLISRTHQCRLLQQSRLACVQLIQAQSVDTGSLLGFARERLCCRTLCLWRVVGSQRARLQHACALGCRRCCYAAASAAAALVLPLCLCCYRHAGEQLLSSTVALLVCACALAHGYCLYPRV